jgi:alpha-ketoglutaric semialdehyde dehydrogenase
MKLTGENFLASLRSAEGDKVFQAVNPATNEQLQPPFHEATDEEVEEACYNAFAAFSFYKSYSPEKKANFIDAIADEISSLGDVLIVRCQLETGLPEARLKGERQRTINQLKLFAAYLREGSWVDARIDHADPLRTPPKPDVRSMERALGPVGIFGASNFPLAFSIAGGDTASALAAGCPVVVKAHPAHPGTSEMIASAIRSAIDKCGIHIGVFSMVHGKGFEVGEAIVRNIVIRAIGFTGSFKGGKALFDIANRRHEPIPVYAEMGSSNPVFILPRALKERGQSIAKDLSASFTLGSGQFCTNPGLVFIEKNESSEFEKSLAESVSAIVNGPMLTNSISDSFRHSIEKIQKLEAVEVLTVGKNASKNCEVPAYVLRTSVQHFVRDSQLEEEIFGPSTILIHANSKPDMLLAAHKLHGHLTATIHGTKEDLEEYSDLISILEQKVGRIIINGFPTGVEVTHAMVHGGPFPATTDSRSTSVGTNAIRRFTRPVCYQNFPQELLPEELKDSNPLKIYRFVNGEWSR